MKNSLLSKWLRTDFGLWAGGLLISLLVYYPAIEAGFVSDVTGGIERIQGSEFSDIIYSFGFPANHQLAILLFYIQLKIFGMNGLGWYLVYNLLHATNAFLLYRVARLVLSHLAISSSRRIAIIGSLLFLVAAFQTEVVVWRACQNYLLSTFFILFSLLQSLQFLKNQKNTHLAGALILMMMALFSFDLALTLPLLTMVFGGFLFTQGRRWLFQLIAWQILLVGGYFLVNQWMFGAWIGHYGAEVHLNFQPLQMLGTAAQYSLKHIFLVRYYPHEWKTFLFEKCHQPAYLAVIILTVFLLGWWFRSKQPTAVFKAAIACFAGWFICILPVLNLYFYYLQWLEGDRYGYLGSGFLSIFLAIIFLKIPRWAGYPLLFLFLAANSFFLWQTNQAWKESSVVNWTLLENFPTTATNHTLLLNVPDNYRGLYLFREVGNGSGFYDALTTVGEKAWAGTIREVVQYNMVEWMDGVRVEQTGNQRLKVTFKQWGNWWWEDGIGASNDENDWYQMTLQGQSYELILKDSFPDDTKILYQDGLEWKEWKWSK